MCLLCSGATLCEHFVRLSVALITFEPFDLETWNIVHRLLRSKQRLSSKMVIVGHRHRDMSLWRKMTFFIWGITGKHFWRRIQICITQHAQVTKKASQGHVDDEKLHFWIRVSFESLIQAEFKNTKILTSEEGQRSQKPNRHNVLLRYIVTPVY